MSDIPVGSPPAPPGRHAAPGGWYSDPVDPAQERYWDGWQWSRNTRPVEVRQAPGVHPYPSYAPPDPAQSSAYRQPDAHGQQPYPAYPPNPYGAPGAARPSGQASHTADGVQLAGWGMRVLAVVIDAILVNLLTTLISAPFSAVTAAISAWSNRMLGSLQSGVPMTPEEMLNGAPFNQVLLLTALQLGAIVAYHVLFLRWKAATPGKLMLRMRVVPVDQGRSGTLSWHQIGVRAALRCVVSPVVWLFGLLDALWPLWQPKRQALHDLAAKTQVVRDR